MLPSISTRIAHLPARGASREVLSWPLGVLSPLAPNPSLTVRSSVRPPPRGAAQNRSGLPAGVLLIASSPIVRTEIGLFPTSLRCFLHDPLKAPPDRLVGHPQAFGNIGECAAPVDAESNDCHLLTGEVLVGAAEVLEHREALGLQSVAGFIQGDGGLPLALNTQRAFGVGGGSGRTDGWTDGMAGARGETTAGVRHSQFTFARRRLQRITV